ncbi:MAG TPA: VOC family protein [Alphaproteobacteria bacterium]|nr:VOC family protein [Alphaproteobacteria bacterium]
MSDQQQGIIPHLVVDDAAKAIDFYTRAFGATEVMRVPAEDGKRLLHAELTLNGARLFLHDDFPEYRDCNGERKIKPAPALGGTPVALHLMVPDCDAAVARAVEAGATVTMPPMDAFWGDRYGQISDPFGHAWSFAHPLQGGGG